MLSALFAQAADLPTCAGAHTLRPAAATREWSDFPAQAPARLECTLASATAAGTLTLRQSDVKRQDWEVSVNGHKLGRLLADEHTQVAVFSLPANLTAPAVLIIATASPAVLRDDIRIDQIATHSLPADQWQSQSTLDIEVTNRMPVRITLTDADGTLLPHGLKTAEGIAARTGMIYTATGSLRIPVPAGRRYTVWATRGFEYSAAKAIVTAKPGATHKVRLTLNHEVQIPNGWTSGDTHLHTLERSGHGDSTVAERILSVAGEGLAWAVSTEHNRTSNFDTVPNQWFRAIPGMEITTAKGHFNAFPWPLDKPVPDVRTYAWTASLTPDMAVIWNHPRDVHSGYRPFDPSHYNGATGEGHDYPGNALEVVNSGAMYSHPLQLAEDWMRLLKAGRQFAAIGSSDSHTVATFLAGQARTYVKGDDVAAAIRKGDTAVSYGLAAFLEQRGDGRVIASVYGPSWSRVRQLRVYADGDLIETRDIRPQRSAGLQWQGQIKARPAKFLVVIATGSDNPPFWPISRPYQPVSPDWQPMTLGISPALRILERKE
ncbi:hypothetical protein F183_A05900 [Bryobacterales bacterium F-183]|nr:hypothetical protein F183_A05900 [Bryobacterales bacterium F-183]